jgi:small subunit ribosomal protein S3
MGQKVIPPASALVSPRTGIRPGTRARRDFAAYLAARPESSARNAAREAAAASVARIQIERPAKTARVTIHTARPGVVIGKKGEDIEKLRKDVSAA